MSLAIWFNVKVMQKSVVHIAQLLASGSETIENAAEALGGTPTHPHIKYFLSTGWGRGALASQWVRLNNNGKRHYVSALLSLLIQRTRARFRLGKKPYHSFFLFLLSVCQLYCFSDRGNSFFLPVTSQPNVNKPRCIWKCSRDACSMRKKIKWHHKNIYHCNYII